MKKLVRIRELTGTNEFQGFLWVQPDYVQTIRENGDGRDGTCTVQMMKGGITYFFCNKKDAARLGAK